MRKEYIYITGVVIFGLIYAWLKKITDNPAFFLISLLYLLLLRFVAEKFGK